MADPVQISRRRSLIGLNASSFSWTVGLGASIPVVPLLAYQFVPDLALAGLVVAIGGVGRLFTGYFTGPLVDRFGRRGVTIVGITIRMIFSFLEGLSGSYLQLVLFRFGSSMGTAIYGTGLTVMMADLASRRDRGGLVGGRVTFSQMGNVLGPLAGGAIWALTGDLRAPFILNGFTKLICLLIFIFVVRETQGYEHPSDAVPAPAPGAVPSPAAPAAAAPRMRDILLTPRFALIAYSLFGFGLFQQGLQYTVLAVYVRDIQQLPQASIGLILSAISLGTLLVAWPAGLAADRWGRRSGLVLGGLLAGAALGYLAVTGEANVPWGLVMGAAAGLIFITAQALAMDLAPPGQRGHFFGVNQAAVSSANLVGPLMVGAITNGFGYPVTFTVVAVIMAIIAPLTFVALRGAGKPVV